MTAGLEPLRDHGVDAGLDRGSGLVDRADLDQHLQAVLVRAGDEG
jgi:hypothetical protein